MDVLKRTAEKMTITERNYKQNKLREQMYHHSQQADWCREEILRLTREYKEQNLNLYMEMFADAP